MKRLGIRWVHDELTSRLGDAVKPEIGLGLYLRETHPFIFKILFYKRLFKRINPRRHQHD